MKQYILDLLRLYNTYLAPHFFYRKVILCLIKDIKKELSITPECVKTIKFITGVIDEVAIKEGMSYKTYFYLQLIYYYRANSLLFIQTRINALVHLEPYSLYCSLIHFFQTGELMTDSKVVKRSMVQAPIIKDISRMLALSKTVLWKDKKRYVKTPSIWTQSLIETNFRMYLDTTLLSKMNIQKTIQDCSEDRILNWYKHPLFCLLNIQKIKSMRHFEPIGFIYCIQSPLTIDIHDRNNPYWQDVFKDIETQLEFNFLIIDKIQIRSKPIAMELFDQIISFFLNKSIWHGVIISKAYPISNYNYINKRFDKWLVNQSDLYEFTWTRNRQNKHSSFYKSSQYFESIEHLGSTPVDSNKKNQDFIGFLNAPMKNCILSNANKDRIYIKKL